MSNPNHFSFSVIVLVGLMVVASSVGNILLKLGADATTSLPLFFRIMDLRIVLGLTIFAASAVIYILLLGKLPLNVAQSMVALQYASVLFASAFFLGEAISISRVFGAVCIILGVLLIGMSA